MGKRHLVLAALVLALGAAVYLNWQFSPNESVVDTGASDHQNADEAMDNRYIDVSTQNLSGTDIPGNANGGSEQTVEAGKNNDFFENARQDREKTRNEGLETLADIISDPSLNESQKTEAVSTTSKIVENMDKEAAIETLIKAKGYNDCVVVISDAQINVIIPVGPEGITSADAAIVRDVVVGQISVSPSAIKIIEAK